MISSHQVQVRWHDLDGLGHVNHATVITYLEEGRDVWLASHGIARDEYVVGRCNVDFRHEIVPTSKTVTVECTATKLGRSSVTTSERIRDESGRIVVEAEFALVLWNPRERGSRPISDRERASLEEAPE